MDIKLIFIIFFALLSGVAGLRVCFLKADMDSLNAHLNATVQAKALCEQKILTLESAILMQNAAIERIKIDSDRAIKTLKEEGVKIVQKWQSLAQTLYSPNASCEDQLKQIDVMQENFFKERE